jgi:glycogen debranching enzyme
MNGAVEVSYRVLFVQPDDAVPEETATALAWLHGQQDIEVQPVSLSLLAETPLGHGTTIWFHWTEAPVLSAEARAPLDAHVRAGGGLLATLAATVLPVQLGWEEVAPSDATHAAWSEEPGDELALAFSAPPIIRGLQSFRGHPLFDGLGTGAYTWAPRRDERFVRYTYDGNAWPEAGRVVAVERSFITINPDRRVAWEYIEGDGWAVCIGGYVHFAAEDPKYRPQLEQLVRNALKRVAPNGSRARFLGGAWERASGGLKLDADVPLPPEVGAFAVSEVGDSQRLDRAATAEFFTLAGSRASLIGKERTGLEEVWFHPFRAVSSWALRSAGESRDGEAQDENPAAHISMSPGVVTRWLACGGRTLEERIVVAPDEPAVVVELRTSGTPVMLELALEADLRLTWPYPPHAAGPLSYAVEGGAVGLQSKGGGWLGVRIEPAPSVLTVTNASDEGRSRVRIRADLELAASTRILLTGATRHESQPSRVEPARWIERSRSAGSDVGLALACGDPELDEAIRWACRRLASYRVHVPELGTSLVAGYGRSHPSSFGDGRPGYAWFFGRDACWTALASLAVGQQEAAREVIEFLGRHQDITGKILHECTTSGVAHYDAADSTPLYLLLAARYLAWTGDAETLEREWPHLTRAYEFCLSTDSDGDGLIENTAVGHGWVEFGRLGGHHVSLYLAGIWVAALAELEVAARALGDDKLADELAYRAAAARSSLELSLYDPLEARYANGRCRDGSLDMVETIMTAVPLALGVIRAERCEAWLDRVAGEDFTTPWGVRLVPRSDPEYRPDGYHTGSVWPLYSGWVSLAEYRARRAKSAFRHWRDTARLFRRYALGAWPEVLHGDEPRAIGVTQDQAWSTAMAVLPLVEGTFGLKPEAWAGRAEVAPQLPAEWSRGTIGGLRVGDSRLSFGWPHSGGEPGLEVRVAGAPLDLRQSDR